MKKKKIIKIFIIFSESNLINFFAKNKEKIKMRVTTTIWSSAQEPIT